MTPEDEKAQRNRAYVNEFARKILEAEAEEVRKAGESERAAVQQARESEQATMQRVYDGWKETAGRWACYVWIASGILWHLTLRGPGLFSLSAAVFIGVGMCLASLIFGGLSYVVQRWLVRFLSQQRPIPADSTVQMLGCGKFIVDTALVVWASHTVFLAIHP